MDYLAVTRRDTEQKQRSAHIQLLAKAGTCCVIARLRPLHTNTDTQTLAGSLVDADPRLVETTGLAGGISDQQKQHNNHSQQVEVKVRRFLPVFYSLQPFQSTTPPSVTIKGDLNNTKQAHAFTLLTRRVK